MAEGTVVVVVVLSTHLGPVKSEVQINKNTNKNIQQQKKQTKHSNFNSKE